MYDYSHHHTTHNMRKLVDATRFGEKFINDIFVQIHLIHNSRVSGLFSSDIQLLLCHPIIVRIGKEIGERRNCGLVGVPLFYMRLRKHKRNMLPWCDF